MVKNPPAYAGDMGLILSPGRSHAAKQLSPGATATEACALEPVSHNERGHHSGKPVHCNWRVAPSHHN